MNAIKNLGAILLDDRDAGRASENWLIFEVKEGFGAMSNLLGRIENRSCGIENETEVLHFVTVQIMKLLSSGFAHVSWNAMADSKLVDRLISFAIAKNLFDDTELSNALLLYGLTALFKFCQMHRRHDLSFKTQNPALYQAVKERFEEEKVSLVKLLLGVLLMESKISLMNQTDFGILALNQSDILILRDLLWKTRTEFTFDLPYPMLTLHLLIRSNFTVPPDLIQQWFNIFLLEENNRRHLCDQITVDNIFHGVEMLIELETGEFEIFQRLAVASLRSLDILSHSCADFAKYMRGKMLESTRHCLRFCAESLAYKPVFQIWRN